MPSRFESGLIDHSDCAPERAECSQRNQKSELFLCPAPGRFGLVAPVETTRIILQLKIRAGPLRIGCIRSSVSSKPFGSATNRLDFRFESGLNLVVTVLKLAVPWSRLQKRPAFCHPQSRLPLNQSCSGRSKYLDIQTFFRGSMPKQQFKICNQI